MTNITAELKYLQWQPLYERERPFQLFINPPPGAADQRISNLVFEKHTAPITDVRENFDRFSLDKNGFMFCEYPTAVTDFSNRDQVETVYFAEVERLLRQQLTGVDRVFIFNWRLRNTTLEIADKYDLNDPVDARRPATHLHIDHSPAAVLNRIKLQFPGEADKLLRGRVRAVNVWRPLVGEVGDWPLALTDGSTISADD